MLELNVIETGVHAHAMGVMPIANTRSADWHRLVTFIARNRQRRLLIQKSIQKDLLRDDRLVLVISDRKELAENIYRSRKNDGSVWYLHGKLPMRERDELWRNIGERRVRCLIATKIADNLNVGGSAGFNTVHLVTPTSPYGFMRRIKPLLRNYNSQRLPRDPDQIIRYYLDLHPWLRATFNKSEEQFEAWLEKNQP